MTVVTCTLLIINFAVVGGVTVIFLATSERVLQKTTATDPSAAASTAVQQENGRGLCLLCLFSAF